MKMLILGASYGSLLSTKLLMAGHDVTLICRSASAALINSEGTEVRIKLRDEDTHRAIRSADLPGTLNAVTPEQARPEDYDMIALAMQEPQYGADEIAELLKEIGLSKTPCMSIMNMPPLPYIARIEGLDTSKLDGAYTKPDVWKYFDSNYMTLCSPDPQAFRPPDENINVLQVGLPTNFKAARFESDQHTQILRDLQSDIENIKYDLDGDMIDLPVKLKVHDSIFVPLAKWSMLLSGNYRCVKEENAVAIKEAVHSDLVRSEEIYNWVGAIATKLGAIESDQVPFTKYASAAESLIRPSSAARALFSGAKNIERVDRLIKFPFQGFLHHHLSPN